MPLARIGALLAGLLVAIASPVRAQDAGTPAPAAEVAAPDAGPLAPVPLPDGGLPADLPETNVSDRAPGDPKEPDLLDFVIPPGREEAVKSLFARIWDAPPPGVTWQGGLAIERELVRAKLLVDGKPAQVLLMHPKSGSPPEGVVVKKGGEEVNLLVLGTCTGCGDAEKAKLTAVVDGILANQATAKAELWKFKPKPVAKPPGFEGGTGGPGVGVAEAPVTPRSRVVRMLRIIGGVVLLLLLVTLIRRRNRGQPPEPPAPSGGGTPAPPA